MQSSQNHIIDKVFLEVNTTDEKTANKIKNNVSSFLNSEVFPKLEQLFDKYDFNNQVFRIDSLDIDFNVQDWDKPDEIKFEVLKSIKQKIDEKTPEHLNFTSKNYDAENSSVAGPPIRQTINKQENNQNTILFFLEYGFLPWFGKQEYIKELTLPKQWLQNLKQHNFLIKLKALFRENKTAIERFVFQFPDEQVFAFIDLNETIQIRNKPELLRYLQNLTPELRGLFLSYLVGSIINKTTAEKYFIEFVKIQLESNGEITNQIVSSWNEKFIVIMQLCFHEESVVKYFRLTEEKVEKLVKEISSVITGTQVRAEEEELKAAKFENKSTIDSQDFVKTLMEKEPPFFAKSMNEIVVRNAGMVLFHPFLNSFFKSFNWLHENGIIYPKKQIHAVQSLHFLATGNDDFFEGDLVLEKFLCGVPLNFPIPNKSVLTAKVKNEVSILLKEVVGHWPALKNTSPDGLRQMFVHRDGKLIQKEKGFRLIVERKAQDILLEKLQWNISIVKLPWKDDLLFVDW